MAHPGVGGRLVETLSGITAVPDMSETNGTNGKLKLNLESAGFKTL